MLCCAVDSSPLIARGCPEKGLPAGGICACAKWTWNMPRWITEGPSAPLALPLHDNPGEGKKGREMGRVGQELETRITSLVPSPVSSHFPWAALILVCIFSSLSPNSSFPFSSHYLPHTLCTSPDLMACEDIKAKSVWSYSDPTG